MTKKQGSADIVHGPGYADQQRAADQQQRIWAEAQEEARAARPDDLTAGERPIWDRLCAQLIVAQRWKPLHEDALGLLVQILARLRKNRALLDDENTGWTYKTTGRHGTQLKARPEVAILNDDFRKAQTLISQFGLTPRAESRILNATQADLFADNEFGDFD